MMYVFSWRSIEKSPYLIVARKIETIFRKIRKKYHLISMSQLSSEPLFKRSQKAHAHEVYLSMSYII